MNKLFKAGILVAVLVVPALFYLFLKFFTQNHYTLTRYYPIIDSTTGKPKIQKEMGLSGITTYDTIFHKVPPFKLVDQEGNIVTEKIAAGKIQIVDFFFTRCSTICPKLSSQLNRIQTIFRNSSNLVIISFSVDPEFDKPNKLNSYAQKYEVKTGKWFLLTGDRREIYTIAQKGYFLPVVDANVSAADPDETFIHSEKLVLVDREGIIRGYYDGLDKADVERLILETRVLMSTYDTK